MTQNTTPRPLITLIEALGLIVALALVLVSHSDRLSAYPLASSILWVAGLLGGVLVIARHFRRPVTP